MKILIIVIVAFLIVIYAYTYIKYKKRKKNHINAVDDFRNKYLKQSDLPVQTPNNDKLIQYMTKYNSTVDYIDKDDFMKESSENSASKIKPKELQF